MSDPVLVCVDYDAVTGVCATTMWQQQPNSWPMPSTADALLLLAAFSVVLVQAWGWNFLGRVIRH